jgi:hypothetical protein
MHYSDINLSRALQSERLSRADRRRRPRPPVPPLERPADDRHEPRVEHEPILDPVYDVGEPLVSRFLVRLHVKRPHGRRVPPATRGAV